MMGFRTIMTHTVGTEIEPTAKILWVDTEGVLDEKKARIKNLHIYDYNLFWMNIRQNIKLRIDAFLSK